MFCPHSRRRFLMCCNVFDPSASRMFIKKTLCLFSAGTAEPEVKKKNSGNILDSVFGVSYA